MAKITQRVRGIREKSIHTFPKTFVRHGKMHALASGPVRMNFLRRKTSGSTYICALHWPGESSFIDEECVDEKCAVIDTHICVNPSGKLVSDQGSQTIYIQNTSCLQRSKVWFWETTSLQLQDTTIPI